MLAETLARGIRVGGVNVAPGEARSLSIALSARAAAGKAARVAVPVWVAVGPKAGPRVSIVAALHGFEAMAARAATALLQGIDPAAIAGSLVIVPVMRPGGRFSPGEHPAATWKFPGNAGGTRGERDAFALFSEIIVGSAALIVLAAPTTGRRAVSSVRGELDDPRTRRLAMETGATAALTTRRRPGSVCAAAAEINVTAIELRADGGPGRQAADVEQLVNGVRSVLVAMGLLSAEAAAKGESRAADPEAASETKAAVKTARASSTGPLFIRQSTSVRAPAGGLVDPLLGAGALARRGALLARIVPPIGGKPIEVRTRREGIVLESPLRLTARRSTRLFVIGSVARGDAARAAHVSPSPRRTQRAPARDAKVCAGWVEHVALPNLGIARLKAKIDTGARTSALHVSRMKVVDTDGGPGRRPILEITVPGGARGARPIKVRAAVREYVVVRDTSGRMERRPVIETGLHIGPFKKRILVTLTNRGDMLFPMLIGRTALGPGIVVDPSRRYLLSIS
jgi:predicted deacylase